MNKFFKYPLLIIIVICVITVALGLQLKNLVIDNDTTKFLPKNHPSRKEFKEIEDTYGGNMMIGVSLKFNEGYVYSKENLEIIEKLTAEFENAPYVESVTSIMNVDYLFGTENGIETMKLVENIPETANEEEIIKQRLLSWKIYKGNFYSDDFQGSLVAITLEQGIESKNAEETHKSIKKILKNYESERYTAYVAGFPTFLVIIAESMRADLIRLIPFVVIILIGTLFLSFRSLGGVVLPTVTVLITTVCTLGLMALFKVNLTLVASAIPVLMIAVGSAYGIHIISHYFDEVDKERLLKGEVSEERNKEIIFHTLKRIGGAVLLAALTTIAGFGSLATSSITLLRDFGIFAAIGVFIAFIIALTLIPSLLILRHKSLKHKVGLVKPKLDEPEKLDLITKTLFKIYNFLAKDKIKIFVLFFIILIVAVFGSMRIKIGNPMVNYFRKSTEIRKADEFANKNFNGTTMLSLIIKGEEPGALTRPDVLKVIDKMIVYLEEKYPDIGNIMSFTDLVKKMNQVMNVDESGDYYEIPYDPAKYRCESKDELKQLIAQYLLLFSGNTKEYVDDPIEPSQTKIEIMLKNGDFDLIRSIRKDILDYTLKFLPEGYKASVSGYSQVQVVVSDMIVDSQVYNIVSSLIAVFLILSLYYKSPIAGIFGVVTLAVPIFLNFGIMGFLGIHLDAGTAMVASVAVGTGIDYAIHFLNSYHHEIKLSKDLNVVTTRALATSGKAIVYNASAVALGFLVLVFSSFMPLVYFGALVGLTMFTASFSAMTLLPALLNIFKPKFITK